MELEFPITHDKCPVCESTVRIVDGTTEKLKKEGALPAGYGSSIPEYAKGLIENLPLVDPFHLPAVIGPYTKVKVIQIFYDYCAECGLKYCTYAHLTEAPFPPPQQVPSGIPGGGFPFKLHG